MAQTHPQAAVAHLHNDLELTYQLLAEPTRWRERVVEKLVIEDADYVSVTSSYQIRLPPDLVQERLPWSEPGQPVRLLLPLTTRHKAVLLDVDLRAGDGRHCAMLLKHQLARLQANYMTWVARRRRDVTGPLPDADDMLYAISAYSPAIWNVQRAETLARRDRVLASYLSLGLGFRVTEAQVHDWSELVEPVEAVLADALSASERVDPRSAAVGLLRSLPYASRTPADAADVTARLRRFAEFVDAADDVTRSLVASYGQRWDVIVDTVVPVDVPIKIQLQTKRPWHDDAVPRRVPWSPTWVMTQRVNLGDAQSGHAEVQVADHDVRVKKPPQVSDPMRRRVGIPTLGALRWTDDRVSIYTAGKDTPTFADLRLKLGLRRPTLAFLWLLILASTASLPLAIVVDSSDLLGRSMALLVLPLAGAILLARPATGAAHRLQRRFRGWLVLATAVVTLTVVLRLAIHALAPDAAAAADVPASVGAGVALTVTWGL